jgi:hypothetical protein
VTPNPTSIRLSLSSLTVARYQLRCLHSCASKCVNARMIARVVLSLPVILRSFSLRILRIFLIAFGLSLTKSGSVGALKRLSNAVSLFSPFFSCWPCLLPTFHYLVSSARNDPQTHTKVMSWIDETVGASLLSAAPTEFGDRCRDRDRWSLTSYCLGALDRIVISVPLGSSRLSFP